MSHPHPSIPARGDLARVILTLALSMLAGCGASSAASGGGASQAAADHAAPGMLEATRLPGPFPTLCAALQSFDASLGDIIDEPYLAEVPCEALLREEYVEQYAQHPLLHRPEPGEFEDTANISPPFLEAKWVTLEDEMNIGSICGFYARTEIGYFAQGFGNCSDTGSGWESTGGGLLGVPSGPEGGGRLLVHIDQTSGHPTEGSFSSAWSMVCGASASGAVSCLRVPIERTSQPPMDDYIYEASGEAMPENLREPWRWSLYLALHPDDGLWVAPYATPPEGTEPPAPGLYRLLFP